MGSFTPGGKGSFDCVTFIPSDSAMFFSPNMSRVRDAAFLNFVLLNRC